MLQDKISSFFQNFHFGGSFKRAPFSVNKIPKSYLPKYREVSRPWKLQLSPATRKGHELKLVLAAFLFTRGRHSRWICMVDVAQMTQPSQGFVSPPVLELLIFRVRRMCQPLYSRITTCRTMSTN